MSNSKFDSIKKTGIWMDKDKAIIVSLYNGDISLNTILSGMEHFHIHGGSGSRTKGGPQDVVHDSKYLEREKHQLKKYFKDVALEIKEAKAIVLFGPAETSTKFNKELSSNYKELSTKVKDIVKADSMTKRQVKAWVKDFYKSAS
ncbi:hypothetical protein [Algibacter sp. R77976]|uniref:hypothetical protein n=1 Tax=Algibacter sp. R77976 TaxID=3093873 RepID=UPI0037CC69C1